MLSYRAEDFGKNTLKDAAGYCLVDGMSFTGTKVLLANGMAIRSASCGPARRYWPPVEDARVAARDRLHNYYECYVFAGLESSRSAGGQ